MATATAPRRSLRWWMIALLMLGSIINYLTRSTLGVAAPTLLAGPAHHRPSSTPGSSATFQGAIMLQPICGYVLDVIGLRLGFAIFAIAWSLISMAHGLAHSWPALAVLRGLLGFAEGSANPAGMKATAEWFPARERGLAGGLFNIGASVGSMLAPPLVVWAILTYNWRTAFVITGVARTRVGRRCGWSSTTRPTGIRALSEAERDYIVAGPGAAPRRRRPPAVDRADPARSATSGASRIPRFLADPTWGTLTFWVPLYLSTVPALRPQADRAVRLDAVPGRGLRLHVRRRGQRCALQKHAASS